MPGRTCPDRGARAAGADRRPARLLGGPGGRLLAGVAGVELDAATGYVRLVDLELAVAIRDACSWAETEPRGALQDMGAGPVFSAGGRAAPQRSPDGARGTARDVLPRRLRRS